MPQKKNPDVPELIRGKKGRVYASLISLLTVMKGLPLAYNRDMQEDKELLFDAVDTLVSSLEVFTGLIKTVNINTERVHDAVINSYILATDIADYLVKRGLSFRQAHSIIGNLVQYAIKKNKIFSELSLEEYRNFSALFNEDVYDITVETSIEARATVGGTAPQQVEAALARAKKLSAWKSI
jgi:argininosuccinate lyase